jgi:uncharacterized protein YbjQ (UPF0145 family)
MVNSQFEVVMKKHFILVKGECGTCVAVDILSDGSSNEISSLTEQGFFIVYENCFAKDTSHAVSVWRSQENGLYPYDEILTSTTNLLGKGVDVSEVNGVVTATVVAGINIFSDIFAIARDIVGGNSATYMLKLDEIKNQVLSQLRRKACELGCDAIVGVTIDVDEISGGNKSMLMVTASGTAVTVVKDN